MTRRALNPWAWQDAYDFSQAVEVTGGERVLYCAGQTSSDENGEPLHIGDMAAQCRRAFDNLEAVLAKAGMTLANVVRLNYYVTDIDRFFESGVAVVGERLAGVDVKPSGTLLGITRLAFPGLEIEIEATAVA